MDWNNREALSEYYRKRSKEKYDSMTPEQKSAYLAKKADYARQYRKDHGLKTHKQFIDPKLEAEYKYLVSNNFCLCCGTTTNIQMDHVFPQLNNRGKHGGGSLWLKTVRQYNRDKKSIQFLCHTCNSSKGTGCYCVRHQKYLGLWQDGILPHLDNLEEPYLSS